MEEKNEEAIKPTEPTVKQDIAKFALLASAILFIAALAGWFWVLGYGLEKPLLGPHSFRQTQTAITARYLAEDAGIFWNYITPVLGKPWEIPLEVPFFQWFVARIHRLLGHSPNDLANLDRVGRMISALAWLACLVPVWTIASWMNLRREISLLLSALLLSSPLYLFWGRAFLIETTGLLFSLGMVATVLWGVEKRSRWYLAIAGALGIAAALCKGTTWTLSAGAGALLLLIGKGLPTREQWKWIAGGMIALGVGYLPAKMWVQYSDEVKMANPFARELIILNSPNQLAWCYGTAEQKLNIRTWEVILQHAVEGLWIAVPGFGALYLLVVVVVGFFLRPIRLLQGGVFLAAFAAGPVIFTNLYFEHSYYWIANGVWFLLAVGVALACFDEELPNWGMGIALLVTAVAVGFGFLHWGMRYRPITDAIPTRAQLEEAWTQPVQAVVPPERTLLIVGNDWNPNSLYYANRKGIAFPTFHKIPFPGPQLEESLAKLEPQEALGAVVINAQTFERFKVGFEEFLRSRGFSTEGTQTAFGILFPAEDLLKKSN